MGPWTAPLHRRWGDAGRRQTQPEWLGEGICREGIFVIPTLGVKGARFHFSGREKSALQRSPAYRQRNQKLIEYK